MPAYTAPELDRAMEAAKIKHAMDLGLRDETGALTQKAIDAAEEVRTRDGETPGCTRCDKTTGCVYTLDANANWVFAFNANSLRRKMLLNTWNKVEAWFPPGWRLRPPSPTDAAN